MSRRALRRRFAPDFLLEKEASAEVVPKRLPESPSSKAQKPPAATRAVLLYSDYFKGGCGEYEQ